MTFDLGGHKLEISRARLNYCGVHRFHAAFIAQHGQNAAAEGSNVFCKSVVCNETIRLMRRNVDNIASEVGKCLRLPFMAYAEVYAERAVRYMQSIGCSCYRKEEYAKEFAPDHRDYLHDVAELVAREGVLDDIAGLIDNLDTLLQIADSGFASDEEIARRQGEVLEGTRSKLEELLRKFLSRRDVSEALDEAFQRMFHLLLCNLCKAMVLADDRFACEPISADEYKMAIKACEKLEDNGIDESKVVTCCLGVLQIAPFLAAAYPPLYVRVGDKSGDLVQLAKLAGVEGMDTLKDCVLPQLYSRKRIRDLSDIGAFRKELRGKWNFYALEDDPDEWDFYSAVKRNVEKVRSTFHRRRLASPEIAGHYRAVYELMCDSDFTSSQKASETAQAAVLASAKKLGIPTDWLEPIMEAKIRSLEVRLYAELEKFVKSLDLTNEQQALSARSAIRSEALRIGYKAFDDFRPLERLLTRYDRRARTVLDREFPTREEAAVHRRIFERIAATDVRASAECCQQTLDECVEIADAAGVNADWLISDLHAALRRHDEESRVRMGYLYDTHEEADAASGDARLAFLAIWSAIKRFTLSTRWLHSRNDLSARTLSRLTARVNMPADDIFVYYNSGILTSGQIGMWFCRAGIGVCSGSVFAEKLLGSCIVSRLIPNGLSERLKCHVPKVAILPWSSMIGVGAEEVRVAKWGLELPGGVMFACSQKKAIVLKGLFDELRTMGAGLTCDLAQGASEVPAFEQVHGHIQFSDWPIKRVSQSSPISLDESDFADDRPKELMAPVEPEDYSSWMEMIVEDTRAEAEANGVKTAQELTCKDTSIFTEAPIDGVSIAHEDVLCMMKESKVFGSKRAYALTDSYLLVASGSERHAYHLAELGICINGQLTIRRCRCFSSLGGGAIRFVPNLEFDDDKGSKYILKVIDTFFGGGRVHWNRGGA